MNEPILRQREYWYRQVYIKLELVKQLRFKELCFIEKLPPDYERKAKVIRMAQGYNLALLDSNFSAFRFLQFPYMNLYFSLATYDHIPQFSYSPLARGKQYHEWTYKGEYARRHTAYDFGSDIDNPNIDEAKRDTAKLKIIFDKYKLPYRLQYSGSKGFHLIIEHKWLPRIEINLLIKMLAELTTMIRRIDNIPSIDDTIIDARRVLKLGYSYVFSNPNTGRICLPLTDEQFQNFDLKLVEPDYVLKHIKLQNRGLLTRHTDQSEEQARKSFWKMAKNFIDVEKYGG